MTIKGWWSQKAFRSAFSLHPVARAKLSYYVTSRSSQLVEGFSRDEGALLSALKRWCVARATWGTCRVLSWGCQLRLRTGRQSWGRAGSGAALPLKGSPLPLLLSPHCPLSCHVLCKCPRSRATRCQENRTLLLQTALFPLSKQWGLYNPLFLTVLSCFPGSKKINFMLNKIFILARDSVIFFLLILIDSFTMSLIMSRFKSFFIMGNI